jgi:predicted amidohydrolase YtcJ
MKTEGQMNKRIFKAAVFSILFIFLSLPFLSLTKDGPQALSNGLTPDMVLINGIVLTVDPKDTVAEAVAVKDGKIMAVGSNRRIKNLIGSDTRIVDLHGCTVTPGLIDSHCHFSGAHLLTSIDLSYPSVQTMPEIVQKVKERAASSKAGDWIQGRGWDEGKLSEKRLVLASDLDPVSPHNPVWLTQTMGHYGVANSQALELAGVTKDTPDPPGGTIDRNPDRTPTGVLKEKAQSLVTRHIPRLTPEQEKKGVEKIIQDFNKEGMTGVKDPGISNEKWEMYRGLQKEGRLTVRVFGLWRSGDSEQRAKALVSRIGPFTRPYVTTGDDHLISGGIKVYLDGSGGARTAWLHEEWNKDYTGIDKGQYGYPVIEPELFKKLIQIYNDAGLHISVHAVGDRAIDFLLDSYKDALLKKQTKGLRHGIIHCNIPTDEAIRTIAKLQKEYDIAYPEMQPTFTWWIGDTYAGNFGPIRSLRLVPLATFLKNGIKWGGGSDFAVTPYQARFGIWASIARRPLRGAYGDDPFGRKEAVDVKTALRAYTCWSAYVMFMENKIGSIEEHKYADLAVWDKNMYSVKTEEIKDLVCQMTLFNGQVVFQHPESRAKITSSGK